MITVLADKYLYQLTDYLPPEADLRLYDPEEGLSDQLPNADALLVRTVTKVNEELLDRIPATIKFIGTGSAGTDHVNQQLLNERGIEFASAAGCNARSVAEYVVTAMLIWADQKNRSLKDCTVGIIGAGHVGMALKQLLDKLAIPVVLYDPPREDREENFSSADLEEVLRTEILSFHVPLITTGPHPTFHWLDREKLARHTFELIINTARGGVIDEEALMKAQAEGTVGDMIIDVWENEPIFNEELARRAFLKTPHIAGYSIQAKLKASEMIADQLADFFGLPQMASSAADPSKIITHLPGNADNITEILTSVHPILNYQEKLTALTGTGVKERGYGFNKIRAEFPLRNEYSVISLPPAARRQYPPLRVLFS